jgi:hypothetical protein
MKEDLKWRLRLALIGAGAGAFVLFRALTTAPGLTEAVYGNGLGPLFASILSTLTGLVPVSLAEVAIVAFVVRQLWGASAGLLAVRNGERLFSNALAGGGLRLGADIGVVVLLFYLLWGFNYARSPLEERRQWNGRAADVEELARLGQEMIEAANFEYTGFTFADDLGEPSQAPERGELLQQLTAGWQEAGGVLGAPRAAILGFGNPKGLIASRLLDYGQASGFYFPWTGEANYNRGTPDVSVPQVIAHEMSHQRGFAREDEANFAGYLAASLAPEPYPRYSAYVFAQRQLLSALARYDRERASTLAGLRLPGVQRDIRAASDYWAQFEGRTSRATRSMNNAYLRTNQVPGGILSYSRSVELLVAYARSRGGWLVRGREDAR